MSDFTLDFVSEDKYEHLAIEVYFKKQRLLQLSKEEGNDAMQVEFLTDLYVLKKDVEMKFFLTDFEAILAKAAEALRACP